MPAENGNAFIITWSLSRPLPDEPLIIAGPRESAVREHCKSLKLRAPEETYKADFHKICRVTLEYYLDLELILEGADSGFLVRRGIQIGTARRL